MDPQKQAAVEASDKILSEIERMKSAQSDVLGGMLSSAQSSAESTRDLLSQQGRTLGSAFRDILESFSGYASEADAASTKASASASQLLKARSEALRDPNLLKFSRPATVRSTTPSSSAMSVGGSRRESLTQKRDVLGVF